MKIHDAKRRGALASLLELPAAIALLLVFVAAGCAAPGEPIARQPAVLTGITDLQAQQSGDSVILTFTLPKRTEEGQSYSAPPQIDVLLAFLAPSSSPAEKNASSAAPPAPQLILSVPSANVSQYRDGDRIVLPVPVPVAAINAHAGDSAAFTVRTRISKRESANSNRVALELFPATLPVQDLRANVTKSAIELSWAPVETPSGGAFGPAKISYRVFRALAPPAAAANATSLRTPSPPEFAMLGESSSPAYDDAHFQFGQTYLYKVRSVAQYESGVVESEDSSTLGVTPRDSFAPAAPQGLVATALLANGSEPAHADLSWAISPERDVAGYNIYRSESEDGPWRVLNSQLLLTPSFRDIPALLGRRYFYRVTAVNRNGNESAPSAAVAVTFPTPDDREKP